ncbi:unnamed protein product, partial [Polarella glacialis]
MMLRWAFGDAVVVLDCDVPAVSLLVAFDLLEASSKYELERLGALLREAMLEALDLDSFAVVLRESHVRQITGLKQGCMRFALHNFDALVERPEVFMGSLSELPEVVSDLFRLSRTWKDEDASMGRGGSSRPAPAPPSTLVSDFARLFEAAREEEERGETGGETSAQEDGNSEDCRSRRLDAARRASGDLAPDCRILVGEDMYLGHSAVLAARSDFLQAVFTSDMVERASLMVTLQHVQGDPPRRESMMALLHFLYTGRTSKVTGSNALDVLALIGGEQCSSECGYDRDRGGYLQLH